MRRDWRRDAKLVLATATVTSAAWLIGGAVLFQQMRPQGDHRGTPPAPQAILGAVAPPSPSATAAAGPAGRLLIPVRGVSASELVDTFAQAREGGTRVHDAIDIMAPRGTPVLAAAAGTVEKLFVSERGGNTVYVRTPDGGFLHYYAHLDAYAPGLVEGMPVAAGTLLGTVGSTGNADPAGPHLHFAVLRTTPGAKWYSAAVPLNPYPLLKPPAR